MAFSSYSPNGKSLSIYANLAGAGAAGGVIVYNTLTFTGEVNGALTKVTNITDEDNTPTLDMKNASSEFEILKNTKISGDLTVTGATTTVSSQTVTLEDNSLLISSENTANITDQIYYGKFNDGAAKYNMIVLNKNDDSGKVFLYQSTSEPTGTVQGTPSKLSLVCSDISAEDSITLINTGVSNYTNTIQGSASQTGNVTYYLPPSVPAGNRYLYMDNGGKILTTSESPAAGEETVSSDGSALSLAVLISKIENYDSLKVNSLFNVTLAVGAQGQSKIIQLNGCIAHVQTAWGTYRLFNNNVLDLLYDADLGWISKTLTPIVTYQQSSKLLGSGYSGTPRQGLRVAISGDGNTIASAGENDNGGVGAVWIFVRSSGSTWTQQGSKLVSSDFSGGPNFRATSLSYDGNTLAFAGKNSTKNGAGQGQAVIFTRSGTTWSEQKANLFPSDPLISSNQNFGQGVSLDHSGNYLIVSASSDTGSGTFSAVWVFSRSGSTWSQVQRLTPTGGDSSEGFQRCELCGKNLTFAVGAPSDGTDGAVYIYEFGGSTWSQTQRITTSSTTSLGSSLDISDDGYVLAVGDENESGGRGRIFRYNGSTYVAEKIFTKSGSSYMGSACALSENGEFVIFGDFDGGTGSYGTIYCYKYEAGEWIETHQIAQPDDRSANTNFSISMDYAKGTLVIGGNGNDSEVGAAWIYN